MLFKLLVDLSMKPPPLLLLPGRFHHPTYKDAWSRDIYMEKELTQWGSGIGYTEKEELCMKGWKVTPKDYKNWVGLG